MNSSQRVCGTLQLGGCWFAVQFDVAPNKTNPDYNITFLSDGYETQAKAFSTARKQADLKTIGLIEEALFLDKPLISIIKKGKLWFVIEIQSSSLEQVSGGFLQMKSAVKMAKIISFTNNTMFLPTDS